MTTAPPASTTARAALAVDEPACAIVMPFYNEADGIALFLDEIDAAFRDLPHVIVAVDDASTDRGPALVEEIAASHPNLILLRNPVNLGHGPSTYKALKAGLETGAGHVIAVDGDGQFPASEIRRLLGLAASSTPAIVEGVRSGADVPGYRRVVSHGTRLMVWARSRVLPRDANTPLRIYRRDALATVLARLPDDTMIPNLTISALTRSEGLHYREVPVTARNRLGTSPEGSTWQARRRNLPSRRFVAFCAKASSQWVRGSHPVARIKRS